LNFIALLPKTGLLVDYAPPKRELDYPSSFFPNRFYGVGCLLLSRNGLLAKAAYFGNNETDSVGFFSFDGSVPAGFVNKFPVTGVEPNKLFFGFSSTGF
jgi:hypothetical protein